MFNPLWRQLQRFLCLIAATAGVLSVHPMASAQEQGFVKPKVQPDDEAAAQKMIQQIRTLVLPQQKQLAREMIRKYPDTHLAELAVKLLAEYERYDQLRAEEDARAQERNERVREYWKSRRIQVPADGAAAVTVSNSTDEPVVYQYKGWAMAWSDPVRLRPGDTHRFYYPVLCRRALLDGVVQHNLSVGTNYVFRKSDSDAEAHLFRGE